MRVVDTHAHLDFSAFDADRDQLIRELEKEGIGVINPATDLESNEAVDELSHSHQQIWGALGLHPTEITENVLLRLPTLLKDWEKRFDANPKLVALGEIGLDYFHERERAETQKTALREMLSFAVARQLPVIFHCRDAYGDLLTILRDFTGLLGVIHCFSGTTEQANQFLDLGYYLSFTANITYPKNGDLRVVVREAPQDKLMIETDSPFLSPQETRGERNDPRQVVRIGEEMAAIQNRPLDEVLKQTTHNAQNLFRMDR